MTFCHSRESAEIQSPGTCGQVWMPAFAGMTPTFLSCPLILNDSRDEGASRYPRFAVLASHRAWASALCRKVSRT